MSTDAERLAALLDDALYRDEGIWRAAGKADTDAIAARLIAAGVGFQAEGLDVALLQEAINNCETDDGVPWSDRVTGARVAAEYARLQSEAPAPEDV